MGHWHNRHWKLGLATSASSTIKQILDAVAVVIKALALTSIVDASVLVKKLPLEQIFTKDSASDQMRLNSNPEIGCIAAITGIRSFVYWDISRENSDNMHKYWREKGSKNFLKIDPNWMQEHYGDYRRIVQVDCKDNIHLIFFNHVI